MISKHQFNKSSFEQIRDHLWRVDEDFIPALHTYIDIDLYAAKLKKSAILLEFYDLKNLVGLMGGYYNPEGKFLFVSNFSIEKKFRGSGMQLVIELISFLSPKNTPEITPEIKEIGNELYTYLTDIYKETPIEIQSVHSEVRNENQALIHFYKSIGFRVTKNKGNSTYLILDL